MHCRTLPCNWKRYERWHQMLQALWLPCAAPRAPVCCWVLGNSVLLLLGVAEYAKRQPPADRLQVSLTFFRKPILSFLWVNHWLSEGPPKVFPELSFLTDKRNHFPHQLLIRPVNHDNFCNGVIMPTPVLWCTGCMLSCHPRPHAIPSCVHHRQTYRDSSGIIPLQARHIMMPPTRARPPATQPTKRAEPKVYLQNSDVHGYCFDHAPGCFFIDIPVNLLRLIIFISSADRNEVHWIFQVMGPD